MEESSAKVHLPADKPDALRSLAWHDAKGRGASLNKELAHGIQGRGGDECIVNPVSLRKVVREVWAKDRYKVLQPFGVVPQSLMWLSFVVSFAMCALNVFFVVDVASKLHSCEHSVAFCAAKMAIAYTEAGVVCLHAVRIVLDLGLMFGAGRMGLTAVVGEQSPIFVSNLKIASGFSLLAFVPVPPKLLYWLKYRKRLWQLLVKDPLFLRRVPSLTNKSTWHRLNFSFWREHLNLPAPLLFPIWLFLMLIWFICVFTVQVLIPLSLPFLVVLAPIAFMVKMEALPPVHEVGDWLSSDWLTFFGTLNQTAKVWAIGEVEQTAVMTMMNKELQTKSKRPKPGQLMSELSQAMVQELGVLRACVLSVSLDAKTMSQVFGRFLIFDPEGEDIVPDF